MAALERHVLGRRAERMPPVAEELRRQEPSAEAKAGRDEAALQPPPLAWRPVGPDDELLRTLMPDEEV